MWFVYVFSARVVCDAHESCCPRCRSCARCPIAAGGWNLFGDHAERLLAPAQRIEQIVVELNDYSDDFKVPSL
eukprot:gene9602-biopygen5167